MAAVFNGSRLSFSSRTVCVYSFGSIFNGSKTGAMAAGNEGIMSSNVIVASPCCKGRARNMFKSFSFTALVSLKCTCRLREVEPEDASASKSSIFCCRPEDATASKPSILCCRSFSFNFVLSSWLFKFAFAVCNCRTCSDSALYSSELADEGVENVDRSSRLTAPGVLRITVLRCY